MFENDESIVLFFRIYAAIGAIVNTKLKFNESNIFDKGNLVILLPKYILSISNVNI